jgi:hypothetical protein
MELVIIKVAAKVANRAVAARLCIKKATVTLKEEEEEEVVILEMATVAETLLFRL